MMIGDVSVFSEKTRIIDGDLKINYMNKDLTFIPSPNGHRMYFWEGEIYENLPVQFPILLKWGNETVRKVVTWHYGETNAQKNSNAYAVADNLVNLTFPGKIFFNFSLFFIRQKF